VTREFASSRVTFEKGIYQIARIDDPATIAVWTEEFFLGASDSTISEILVVDLNQNGFEEGDYAILQPSGEAIPLTEIPERIREMMREWEPPREYEVGLRVSSDIDTLLAWAEKDDSSDAEIRRCTYCTVKQLLHALQKLYLANELRFYLERGPDGSIQAKIWDFKPQGFYYTDCKAEADTLPLFDVLQVSRRDTMLVTERNFFDMVFVTKTVAESIFVAPRGLNERRVTWRAGELYEGFLEEMPIDYQGSISSGSSEETPDDSSEETPNGSPEEAPNDSPEDFPDEK
jgi:hypothetical protein